MNEVEGKLCVITGANSGIGKETALGLARNKSELVMVVRNQERGNKAREDIVAKSGNSSIDLMVCDLSSMEAVRRFVQEFKAKYDRLDVLINNAGAVFYKRQVTPEGFERTLAVDYLAPFLLTNELLPLLKSSAPSRVIDVSSGLYKSGKIDLEDLQGEKYAGMKAYANAKLMILTFTYELAERVRSDGVTVNAVLPGFVATNLGKNSGSRFQAMMFGLMRPFQTSAHRAAETLIYLASSPAVAETTGQYFYRCHPVTPSSAAQDDRSALLLWQRSAALAGLPE